MLARHNKKNKSKSVCSDILSMMHLSNQKEKIHRLLNNHIKGMSAEEIYLIIEAAVSVCDKDVLKSLVAVGVNLDVGIKMATHLGDESTVRFLLDITPNNFFSHHYIASIELAVKRGNEEILRLFLSPVRNAVDVACDPLLNKVARYGHIHLLDLFWSRVERKTIVGALDRAIQYSQLAFAQALQERGVSLDELRVGVFSALFSAARSNDLKMLDYVNDNIQVDDLGHALFVAAENNFLISADFILSKPEANVDFVEINNQTPLLAAIKEGSSDFLKRLLDKGANPCGVPGTIPPIVAAVRCNFPAALDLLIKKGASFVLPSYNLWQEAVKVNADRAIVFLGMYYKKNINDPIDARGNTVLHIATTLQHKESIISLIELGADADLPNLAGETPLHIAARGSDKNIYLVMFSGWGGLSLKEKQLISQGKLSSCLSSYNLDLVTSLVALGFPDIFRSYRLLIFENDPKNNKKLDPQLAFLAFESVLAASEIVSESVDARAMILPMLNYIDVANDIIIQSMPDMSGGDAISLLDSLFLSHSLTTLLSNYNAEKKKQQIVVLNVANSHAIGRHVINAFAYIWLEQCESILAFFEKAVVYRYSSSVDLLKLNDKLQSVIGLCEFYKMINDLYLANEKMLNDDRYNARFKSVLGKALQMKDGVTKKIRQSERVLIQEQSKQQATRKLEEKVKAQRETQILEGERLKGLQEKYAKEAIHEVKKKPLDAGSVIPLLTVNPQQSMVELDSKAVRPSVPIKIDVATPKVEVSFVEVLEPALCQKVFKLTAEIKQAFVTLDVLSGELYAVGSSVIAMIRDEVVTDIDIDMIGFNVDVLRLASLGFYQSREMPSLYRNKQLNIDLYIIQDSSSNRLQQAMKVRDFTACSLMCDGNGVVFALNASYFDDAINGVLKTVDSPAQCFQQDCIRVLRAIKYYLKGFSFDDELLQAIRSWSKSDFTPHEKVHMALIMQGLLQRSQLSLVEVLIENGLLKKLFSVEQDNAVDALRVLKCKISAVTAREYKCSNVSEVGLFAPDNSLTLGIRVSVDALFAQPR